MDTSLLLETKNFIERANVWKEVLEDADVSRLNEEHQTTKEEALSDFQLLQQFA